MAIELDTHVKILCVADGDVPQALIASQCAAALRSVERILAEPAPTFAECASGERKGAPTQCHPPKAGADKVTRTQELLCR
jgi:hypothetical protein